MTPAIFDRSQYPGLRENIYLNQASLGLIGQPAVQAMHDFLDDVARYGNLRMSDDAEVQYFEELRKRGAQILHCKEEELAILASASELLGQLPYMLKPKTDSQIVAVSTDFPAVTRPWLRYAAMNDCRMRFVDDIASEDLTDSVIASIDDRTAVVAVSSVQFSTGSMIDIGRLRRATKDANAALVVDVTQAAGTLPIDSGEWGADAVVTSGYKWLGGHGGVALAAIAPHLLESPPPLPGWMGTADPFMFDAKQLLFSDDARRFTQSTMSYISMAGLVTALDHLLAASETVLQKHASSLAAELIEGIRPHGWYPFRGLEDSCASPHIISLGHPEVDADSACRSLRDKLIVCGTRNGRIRISLAPFNDSNDVNALIDALVNDVVNLRGKSQ